MSGGEAERDGAGGRGEAGGGAVTIGCGGEEVMRGRGGRGRVGQWFDVCRQTKRL